jgi:RNA polymerase I-specific transcription initiation factor RRN3
MVSVAGGSGAVASANLNLSSPLKPILSRKPKSVLETRSRDTDSDASGSERQPSKRQKTVAFDETLNTVKEIGTKSLREVKGQVKKALEGHSKGDDGYYDELTDIFASDRRNRNKKDDAVTSQELLLYVLALTSHTPLLARCSGLIKHVLSCQWLTRDDVFAKAYVQFLCVSHH